MPQTKPSYASGDKYNMLTLTGKSYIKERRRYIEVMCECGKRFFTYSYPVTSGLCKSCGCRKRAFLIKMTTSHDMSFSPIYHVWQGMVQRCQNSRPTSSGYRNYFSRGITVCDEWRNSFDNFHKWAIANGWKKGLTIERENNDGNYEPSNCKVASYAVQARNKRTNYFITALGETKCFKDWILDKRCKVSHGALFYRLHTMKMNPEEAITTPPLNSLKCLKPR